MQPLGLHDLNSTYFSNVFSLCPAAQASRQVKLPLKHCTLSSLDVCVSCFLFLQSSYPLALANSLTPSLA